MRRRALPLLALPGLAHAAWPSRPIRLLVGFPPGGIIDAWARAIAAELPQPVVVEHRPGAAGMLAAEAVSRAAPDGHTLLCATDILLQWPLLDPRIGFDLLRDLTPIGRFATAGLLLVMGPAVPAEAADMAGFLQWARGRPLFFGQGAAGSAAHALSMLLARDAGLDITHVPYRGEPPVLAELLASRLHAAFLTGFTAGEALRAGRLRALASVGQDRNPLFGESLPRLSEVSGLRPFPYRSFCGVFAPPGLAAEVRAPLDAAFAVAFQAPALRARLAGMASIWAPMAGGPFIAEIQELRGLWAGLVAEWGLAAQAG